MGGTTATVRKNLGRKNDGQVHFCCVRNVSVQYISKHGRSNKHSVNLRSIQDSNNDPLNVQAFSLNRNETTIPVPVDYCTEIDSESMMESDVTMERSHNSKLKETQNVNESILDNSYTFQEFYNNNDPFTHME